MLPILRLEGTRIMNKHTAMYTEAKNIEKSKQRNYIKVFLHFIAFGEKKDRKAEKIMK